MKTVNHECYVDLEVAKLLKEAGFDWNLDVDFVYADIDKEIQFLSYIYVINNYIAPNIKPDGGPIDRKKYRCCYLAPTLDVSQRWLRENKDFDINILTDLDSVKRLYYVRYIVKDGHYKTYYITNNQSYVYFNTYEEAQEAGIKKALEIILEQGE